MLGGLLGQMTSGAGAPAGGGAASVLGSLIGSSGGGANALQGILGMLRR